MLLRDVAYGQIPRRARADKHRRAAEWIEGLGRPDDHAELLAHHYKEALALARAVGVEDEPDLVERARESLLAAGDRAMSLSAYAAPRVLRRGARADTRGRSGTAGLLLGAPALSSRSAAKGSRFWRRRSRRSNGRRRRGRGRGPGDLGPLRLVHRATGLDRPLHVSGARGARGPAPVPGQGRGAFPQSGFDMLAGRFEQSIRFGEEALPLVTQFGMEGQRARLHIVVGHPRCCLGDAGGLDEIRAGIEIAASASNVDMMIAGYSNLSSELHFMARLSEARREWQNELELSERYEVDRPLRGALSGKAAWACLDGRWDEALAVAEPLIAEAERGNGNYTDAMVYSTRAWIRLARGDHSGADRDSREAAERARASDAQAQAAAFPIRAAVAIALGGLDEAGACATELAELGPVAVTGLSSPFPTLADVAWVFRDLGREDELVAAILDKTPIDSLWVDAARAITAGELTEAAETISKIGHAAAAAYAGFRASEALAAEGRHDEARALREEADRFHRAAGAVRFLGDPRLRPLVRLAASRSPSVRTPLRSSGPLDPRRRAGKGPSNYH